MVSPSLPATLCRPFLLSEIISATNNFSTDLIIGKGSFGNVYKATMNSTTVAAKRRSSESKQGLDEFWAEIKLLSQCRHSHIIHLIGFCVDQDANEMILLYEYMPNGTLSDNIYKKNEKSVFLSWEQRLKICIGVGHGLQYLHTFTGTNQIVVHRDLKCSNILLDADWKPRISDFGLCKKRNGKQSNTPDIASVKGTVGYMDPHYRNTRELSPMADVYAFGVVLLEVLCGRRHFDPGAADGQKGLVLWFKKCIKESGAANSIIDPGLRGSLANDGLRIFLDITFKCLKDEPWKRPTLAEVVWKLESVLAKQDTAYSSSSSVDDEIYRHFNQVAYSSTSANSDVDQSRYTDESGSTDTIKQDPGSESTVVRKHNELKSSSENNGLELPVNLQSTHVKANGSISASFLINFTCSDSRYDYEELIRMKNPHSIVIDNESCKNATVVEVNGINSQEVQLEVVQVLTDIDCIFTRASITSDGSWSMNVFTVTDPEGKKIANEKILDCIQKRWYQVDGPQPSSTASTMSAGLPISTTVIELIGSDRPGLLSDVCTALLDLKCNVMNASVWTHNTSAAFIILLANEESGAAPPDLTRDDNIKERLCNVLTISSNDDEGTKSHKPDVKVNYWYHKDSNIHTERRMHQMMFADCDYERGSGFNLDKSRKLDVNVENWYNKGCSVVTVRCPDRPRLLFDTICTLTDMGYVVLHGVAEAENAEAFQEYCIRHVDGSVVNSDIDRQRLIQCIKAAIERRVSEGLKIEVCTTYRIGLLADITRIFCENNIMVTRAEVETQGDKAINTFYVRNALGYPVDSKIIDSVRKEIEEKILKAKDSPQNLNQTPQESPFTYLKIQT